MDAYPPGYVDHNLPLVLLAGLEPEHPPPARAYPARDDPACEIFSDFPPLVDATAELLLAELLAQDASDAPWNARSFAGAVGFSVKQAGRTFLLPPHKAQPPTPLPNAANDAAPVLHSPISPLTPSSPTYPDGIMTPLWVTKHQDLVPAAFVNFFPLTLDSNMASLRDNQLKIEINTLKKAWAASGYKTRFVVALICEDGTLLPADVNDRISSIRRATQLDPKNILVLTPAPTQASIRDFVKSLFSSLQGPCVDYYRDLSKHARRKRNKGVVPPPTAPPTSGTSQTLTAQGWNVRYEFKLGVFAEFRQEMDAACRSYESAYELLFGEEMFDTIAGWSPRFNDARLLADSLAIRIIRCLLWSEQTSLAVRTWATHRRRIGSIVDRRGKGTRNYGWEAWEARWSLVMADLMRRASLSALYVPDGEEVSYAASPIIYALPEKTMASNERLYPWELLHHEGYWLARAAKHTALRRLLAEKIPDDERSVPDQNISIQQKARSHVYDTYLAPEPYDEYPISDMPGRNHSQIIVNCLAASSKEFSNRRQLRMVEQQKLTMAKELMRLKEWQTALDLLRPVWTGLTWRRDGWWQLMVDFGWALRECARRAEDLETILRVDWELMNCRFISRPGWHYDLKQSIAEFPVVKPKPSIVLNGESVVSCLFTSFVFEKAEGNVGESLRSQLVIKSCAHSSAAPILASEVRIMFEGGLRPICLQTSSDVPFDHTEISDIALTDSSLLDTTSIQSPGRAAPMAGAANLTFAPGQAQSFNLACIPREAGEVKVASITVLIEDERFDLSYVNQVQSLPSAVWWSSGKKGAISRRIGKDRDTSGCTILPKPPKVVLKTPTLRDHYYTDEHVILDIEIYNEEDEPAELSVEVRLIGPPETSAQLHWADDSENGTSPDESLSAALGEDDALLHHVKRRGIGRLEPSSHKTLFLNLTHTSTPLDYELEISTFYHLVSDVETPIFKTATVDLSFIRPFETHYELTPRLHPDPWPDFFHCGEHDDADESEPTARGIKQRWSLNCKMISFAHEPLMIEEVSLVVTDITGGLVCRVGSEICAADYLSEILPDQCRESDFLLELQRLTLDDRQSTVLNLALDIRWCRQELLETSISSHTIQPFIPTTRLPVPRFAIPMGEPRVLVTTAPSSAMPTNFIHLDYTLENPSMHFLTFNITMEASDQFAFSGPKTIVVQLVPLSRHTLRYNLLATGKEKWIQPQLVVVDSYYNKTLRVLPAEVMRVDKKGILVNLA
ncbi:hypothetical protein LOZ12_000600 [Ophidiomyces ophidiicola]|uniref:Uncharacterized protein n=1 Tax=Ophidiomyces ophidiicola TaxID=1387563 RepID=A0ACB8V3Y0_9EURO|nr:uncharacterized protein LOZ57_000043 [Ophidiomyces ophidiicola]KAI1922233.1 hypothetical protein LOZ64_001346 [Ophidiomyces ophidiicola]KAI1942250.1 hypothetical protein LOZ62_004630 [Ophidiomyces ophidiicola]KAI1953702.1 hypothetical protein LOZ57_000043 [Ophidiomyces ophidiicola]KAI2011075.1 hypothetical protein LOZ50_000870 [Ophidiomyces ophidiicola]KAI2031356.1 hypothetical protein LOZ45_001419 [Ophidiomyces ophidiicola]